MTTLKFNRQPVQKSLNSFLDEFFNEVPAFLGRDWNGKYVPPVNIQETEEDFQLELMAPGRDKENFALSVEENTLTISYEKKEQAEARKEKSIIREFTLDAFKRSFNLGEQINAEGIQAKYEQGILRLVLPKKPVTRESAKQITVQ